MKFTYIYKTSDGVRHEGKIEAKRRDDVFATLRQRKIKPIKVIACDGSKANGADYGVRKRVVVAVAALAAAAAAALAWLVAPSGERTTHVSFDDTTRRQPIGDELTVEKGVRTGWADVFATAGDRFLASFAIPGVAAAMRTTTADEVAKAMDGVAAPLPSDSIEVRQVKAMLAGIKAELREYLKDGGTVGDYCKRLVQRQEQEIRYRQTVKNELDAAVRAKMPRKQLEELWEKRNAMLRGMGIKLVPMPEK